MNIDLFADILCPLQLIRESPRNHPENALCVKQCRWYVEEMHDCAMNLVNDRLLEVSNLLKTRK